jgi:excisionase family DNA binding protein
VKSTYVSPKDAAIAIGASESSIKRWVDDGLLTVERTAGGHRRIPVSEVVRFARTQGLNLRDPVALGLPMARPERLGAVDDQLFTALTTGNDADVRDCLVAAFLGGTPISTLADGPIRHAFAKIGEMWQHGEEGVAIEHHATMLMAQALEALRGLIPALPSGAPVALGGAPGGDPYLLPSALVASVLGECGFKAVDLGPNTPSTAIEVTAPRYRPRLVWRAVTGQLDLALAVRDLRRLAERIAPTPLVIGGRRLVELRANGLGSGLRNIVTVNTMSELAAYARGLLDRGASSGKA